MNAAATPAPVARPRAVLYVLLIAVAALWVAVPGLDFRSIENHEHERFARVAQNILWSGDWILLENAGAPYISKPPLLMWLIALFSQPFGHVNPWTARLPSALASFAGALATFGIGSRLANRRVGLLAALLLLTSWKWTWYAHSITTDMLLSGCIAVSLYCCVRAVQTGRQAGWWFAAGVLAGLGAITKGPPAIIVPVAVGVSTWWWLGTARPRVRRSVLLVAAGCAAVAVPWVLLLADRIGWGGMWRIVDVEILSRLGAAGADSQAKPVWYYAEKLPADILPWTLLWPALWLAVRPRTVSAERRTLALLGWVWAVLPVVLFTLSSGKAARFILCAYPGWALLGGVLLDGVFARIEHPTPTDRRVVQLPLYALAVLVLLVPFAGFALPADVPHRALLVVIGRLGCLLSFMGGYLLWAHRDAARLRVVLGILMFGTLAGHAVHLRLLAEDDDADSPYKVAALAVYDAAEGRPVVSYGLVDYRLIYYFARAPLPDAAAMRARFETGEPVAGVFLPEQWAEVGPAVAAWTGEVREVPLPDHEAVLPNGEVSLRNRTVVVVLSRDAPAAILPAESDPAQPKPAFVDKLMRPTPDP